MSPRAASLLAFIAVAALLGGCRTSLRAPTQEPAPWDLGRQGRLAQAPRAVIRDYVRDLRWTSGLPSGYALPTRYPALTRRTKRWDDWLSLGASGAILAYGFAAFGSGDPARIENVGHAFKKSANGAALGVAALHVDPVGMLQFGTSAITTGFATDLLKTHVGKLRPNDRSDTTSFPSGHTASAFASASFLHTRYGPKVGVPAYLAASLTAASRVAAGQHFMDDVLGGASLAMMVNWLTVRPLRTPSGCREVDCCALGWRYEFSGGLSGASRNQIQVPLDTGTPIDIAAFDHGNGSAVYTAATLEWSPPGTPHQFAARLLPYDVQEVGTFAAPTSIGGITFPQAIDTRARYTANEFRLRYRRRIELSRAFHVRVGPQVSLVHQKVDFAQPGLRARGSTLAWQGGVHGFVGFEPWDHVLLWAEVDGLANLDSYVAELRAGIRITLDRAWDVGVGGLASRREIRGHDFENDFNYRALFVSVGHSFR